MTTSEINQKWMEQRGGLKSPSHFADLSMCYIVCTNCLFQVIKGPWTPQSWLSQGWEISTVHGPLLFGPMNTTVLTQPRLGDQHGAWASAVSTHEHHSPDSAKAGRSAWCMGLCWLDPWTPQSLLSQGWEISMVHGPLPFGRGLDHKLDIIITSNVPSVLQLCVPDSRWCPVKCEPCSTLLWSWVWLASIPGWPRVNTLSHIQPRDCPQHRWPKRFCLFLFLHNNVQTPCDTFPLLPAYFMGSSCLYEAEGVTGYQVSLQTRTWLAGIVLSASNMMSAEVFLTVYLRWTMPSWSIWISWFSSPPNF